jgi:hypothetical protein
MKINLKNNSNISSEKYSAISDFLKFSQSRSRLKRPIDIVLVDNSKILNLENRYFIMTKDIPFSDVINILSEVWITEFSSQNKIPCTGRESTLLSQYFFKNNPQYQNLL